MEPVASILSIIEMCKIGISSLSLLESFFKKDILIEVLEELGALDFKAAIESLNQARISNDPRREVAETVTHLRNARLKFEKAAEKETRWFFGMYKGRLDERENFEKVTKIYLLMFLCMLYLNERQQAISYIEKACDYFERYARLVIKSEKPTDERATLIGDTIIIHDEEWRQAALENYQNIVIELDQQRSELAELRKLINV